MPLVFPLKSKVGMRQADFRWISLTLQVIDLKESYQSMATNQNPFGEWI